eukprot:COSAG02_NODE_42977_length_379_cov_0.914286_1_plen_56_part_10
MFLTAFGYFLRYGQRITCTSSTDGYGATRTTWSASTSCEPTAHHPVVTPPPSVGVP